MDARRTQAEPGRNAQTGTDVQIIDFSLQRRGVRRHLDLPCEVISHYWDEPMEHRIRDLSAYGMWINTFLPLHTGAEVVLSFRPPAWTGQDLIVFSRVARVVTGRLRSHRGDLGMGIEFWDLSPQQRLALDDCVRRASHPQLGSWVV